MMDILYDRLDPPVLGNHSCYTNIVSIITHSGDKLDNIIGSRIIDISSIRGLMYGPMFKFKDNELLFRFFIEGIMGVVEDIGNEAWDPNISEIYSDIFAVMDTESINMFKCEDMPVQQFGQLVGSDKQHIIRIVQTMEILIGDSMFNGYMMAGWISSRRMLFVFGSMDESC